MFDRPIRVRLKVSLTQYHTALLAGIEGVTVGVHDIWSLGSDQFIGVHFSNAGTFAILRESLEITDEQFLIEKATREQEKWEQLKEARDVVRYLGPKGGFKSLSYEYRRKHLSTGSRDEADLLIDFFKKQGIPVRDERWR
jgi:hypothetical protein